MKTARATACSNIALVKYWGKRAGVRTELNLPAVGSLSLTLDALRTETTVAPAAPTYGDRFELDGAAVHGKVADKVFAHLDRVWSAVHGASPRPRAEVASRNHFPTASGLASSASGFCALTVAAAAAFELDLDRERISQLSRMGSGSAARSVWGGFVRLDAGTATDGSDCIARPLSSELDLRLVVVQTTHARKAVGSTEGMEHSRLTSPYHAAWVEGSLEDLDAAEAALGSGELATLGRVAERSCFRMHACMMGADPALIYWNGATVDVVRHVIAARHEGLPAWVTIDAGPHVKVLCATAHADEVVAHVQGLPGVEAVVVSRPGPDAHAEVIA